MCGAMTSHMIVTAPPDDIISKKKRHALDVVRPKCVDTELPKTAAKPKAGTPRLLGGPPDATNVAVLY